MKIEIFNPEKCENFQPVTCTRLLSECPVAGSTIEKLLKEKIEGFLKKYPKTDTDEQLNIRSDFWASEEILIKVIKDKVAVKADDDSLYCFVSNFKNNTIPSDQKSICLNYSWDILKINEKVIGDLQESDIKGIIRENVVIDGHINVGEGTVILPGVFIEGNAIIGNNCKIGPNCYIRGNTHVGDNCHIGQSVEIKNSILMDKVSVGHLSYVGDAVIGEKTNFGAGTIMANLRHDGKNHKSIVNGELIDTGRRKFGVIIGDDVHTGINTSLYPGRKMWPHTSTRPGEIVSKDKTSIK
jgi:UDP-N-acetylglucosamine diphosphorylase / glucose-1-phosphate thymidylyltransferase / UDP-N-acetylgalactosamine diphosphorylase / glucosamine-1-phosphate N-acetyltransferase / galactosamine-1-phosphate N-acetyltransferase